MRVSAFIAKQLTTESGNSVRGIMRRLVMYDYVKRCGIQKMSKSNYHMLFTGGVLNESTMYEDLDKRERLIDLCPMLGVFGAAIGNMTIEGSMSVGMVYPECREIGPMGWRASSGGLPPMNCV